MISRQEEMLTIDDVERSGLVKGTKFDHGRIEIDYQGINNLLKEVKQLREDYEKMSEVLRGHSMDICRHCRVVYRDSSMDHPHYPTLHPWHMDGMCMKEMIE